MLLPCDHWPALLKKPLPENVLPPVFGTKLTVAPPISVSPRPPDSVICISCEFDVSTM